MEASRAFGQTNKESKVGIGIDPNAMLSAAKHCDIIYQFKARS